MPDEHRRQRLWHILVPVAGGTGVAVALAVVVARAPTPTVAQASAVLVACLAGFLLVLGLPVLAGLVWAISAWPRAYRAIPRHAARVRAKQAALQRAVQTLSDRVAQVVIAPRVRWAQVRAVLTRWRLGRG